MRSADPGPLAACEPGEAVFVKARFPGRREAPIRDPGPRSLEIPALASGSAGKLWGVPVAAEIDRLAGAGAIKQR
ncbi:MAG: hypothetical protein H6844_12735 [Alphaproteobacteria bacterium]|nr:hypothetical protein [Alphaproteobacteria bacterium]